MRRCARVLTILVAGVLAVAGTAAASVAPQQETATRRCQLEEFVAGFSTVPGVAVEEARVRLAALEDGEVDRMHTQLAALGNWQALPAVMVSISEAQTERVRELLARYIAEGERGRIAPAPDAQLERFRSDFLFMLDQLSKFEEVVGPEYGLEVATVRAKVESAPAAGIQALQQVWYERAHELQRIFSDATGELEVIPGEGAVGEHHTPDCDKDCGDLDVICWIDEAGCWINAVGHILGHIATFVKDFFDTYIVGTAQKIAALPGEVVQWFTNLFNSVKNWVTGKLNDLVGLLPAAVSDVLNYLGIDWDNVNWNTIAGSIPTIAPPCPQQAVDIAAEVCDRGGDALTQLLYDLAPDDGLSFLFKLGAGLIHHPLAYLCQCNDIAEAIDLADLHADHRQHTEKNLDLQLSTRATQASMNVLVLSLADLDSDVVSVESKIDVIEGTTGRIETNIDIIEVTTDRMHEKVDALTDGNADQQEWLAEFEKLMTRLNIEENLLATKPDTISLFQLPSVWGGHLETVALIVADTIQLHLNAGQTINGAERELARGDAYRAAGDFVRAYEAYRSAYFEAVR